MHATQQQEQLGGRHAMRPHHTYRPRYALSPMSPALPSIIMVTQQCDKPHMVATVAAVEWRPILCNPQVNATVLCTSSLSRCW